MDSLEFLLIVAVFAGVLWWYLANERAGAGGLAGLLALKDDPEPAKAEKKKSYRIKDRPARGAARLRDSRTDTAPKTYRSLDDESARMRQRFRRQDEARYRVKDKATGFKPDEQR
jgi:cbb3-type cytochrome oxidase subunit 3